MNKTRAERFAAVRKASEDQKKENFGGIYFTDKGKKAHLNVLAGKASTFARLVSDDVILHPVRYSWSQLNEAQDAATSLFGKKGVHCSDVSLQNNRAIIGVMDDSADALAEIRAEMCKLGFAEDMYVIEKADPIRFMNMPEGAVSEAEMAAPLSTTDTEITTIMPGGLLSYKTSNGTYKLMASLTFGFNYNGQPYFVGAAHALNAADFSNGVQIYYTPYMNNGYPISENNITAAYNSAERVLLGNAMLRKLTGNYDFTSIRCTQSGLAFSHTAYNGCEVSSIGGSLAVGDTLRLCGVTTRYDADYEIGTCTSIQTSASISGTTISNMIKIDLVGNTGTSGGPIMVYDSDTDAYRLIGMCSAQGTNCVYGANINYVMNGYNLSILPEGSITV